MEPDKSISTSPTPSERFVMFQYSEIKDLTKHFLTLIAGTLVLTVSFSDKILPLASASIIQKILLASCWLMLLLSFVLAGIGIFTNYIAAIAAKEGKAFGRHVNYKRVSRLSYISLDVAGIIYALALLLLAVTGCWKLLSYK